MESVFDPDAPRLRTSVSVNADLLRQAKAHGIGLSAALEERLAELLRDRQRQAWRERNREAIDAANAYLREHGMPLDEYRQF
jgi:antitoxin CcdA